MNKKENSRVTSKSRGLEWIKKIMSGKFSASSDDEEHKEMGLQFMDRTKSYRRSTYSKRTKWNPLPLDEWQEDEKYILREQYVID